MARIKTTAIVSEINGSLSGTTFKGSGSGLVMQAKSYGKKTGYAIGRSSKSYLPLLAARWKGLSDAERSTWSSCAADVPNVGKFGDARPLSGYQWYLRVSNYAMLYDKYMEPILPAPYEPCRFSFAASQFYPAFNLIDVSGLVLCPHESCRALFFATDSQPAHLSYRKHSLRLIAYNGAIEHNQENFSNDGNLIYTPVTRVDEIVYVRLVLLDSVTWTPSIFNFRSVVSDF